MSKIVEKLLSIEDPGNESPEVEDRSEVNEESASVPATNDFRLVFSGHYHLYFMNVSLALQYLYIQVALIIYACNLYIVGIMK
jgi:hypothetical protein